MGRESTLGGGARERLLGFLIVFWRRDFEVFMYFGGGNFCCQ